MFGVVEEGQEEAVRWPPSLHTGLTSSGSSTTGRRLW